MLKTRVVGEELSPPGTGCTLNIKLLFLTIFLNLFWALVPSACLCTGLYAAFPLVSAFVRCKNARWQIGH